MLFVRRLWFPRSDLQLPVRLRRRENASHAPILSMDTRAADYWRTMADALVLWPSHIFFPVRSAVGRSYWPLENRGHKALRLGRPSQRLGLTTSGEQWVSQVQSITRWYHF